MLIKQILLNMVIEVTRQLKESEGITAKELEQFHQGLRNKGMVIKDNLYIYSNNYKALCCLYIFSFMSQQYLEKNKDKIYSKMFLKEQKGKIDISLKKFKINLQKNTNLVQQFQSKTNCININQILLQQGCRQLQQAQCERLIIQLAKDRQLTTNIYHDQFIKGSNKNAVLIGKIGQGGFLFIISSQKAKNRQLQNLRASTHEIPQKNPIKSQQKIKKSKSEPDELKKQNKKNSQVIKKNKSFGDQPENQQILQSNQFTWFEGIVLTVIILALLSHLVGIFDDQIKEYNQKSSGNYYLLAFGQKVFNFLSKTYLKII